MAVLTIQNVRDEGITEEMADDDAVEAAIAECEAIFNDQTGQFFEPIAGELTVDGDNTDSIFLPIPVISVSSIVDNTTSQTMSALNYRVYAGRTRIQDDRRNPKILAKNGYGFHYSPGGWTITGVFGFTESDGSAPAAVKRAMLILTIERLTHPILTPSQVLAELGEEIASKGSVTEEVTDDHKLKYATLTAPAPWDPYVAITSSPFVRKAIKDYQAPFGIDTQTDDGIGFKPLIINSIF